MNATTPANEIPPPHSTAASGAFPTEQTNESTATSGPTTTFSISCSAPPVSVRKRPLKTSIGRGAVKPAIRNPPTISFQSIPQSPRKLCATSDQPSSDSTREPPAEGCRWPVSAARARSRPRSSSRRETNAVIPIHITTISTSPPTNSASVNCQPRKIQRTIPSSKTRFVDVQAAQAGDPVGEQLQRHDRQHGLQEGRRPRDVDHVICVVLDVLVA